MRSPLTRATLPPLQSEVYVYSDDDALRSYSHAQQFMFLGVDTNRAVFAVRKDNLYIPLDGTSAWSHD